jgi:UDP-N-acetylmuramyl pentapeptide phosphotransferase/UDP-N-acetylglucosamine-1-phosphate transferase
MVYTLLAILFFAIEIIYFRIADRYNIIDHPNERSSHSVITIRGGGAIFLVAALCVALLHPQYWLPVAGLMVIGIISFLDDMHTLSTRIRLLFHIAAVTLVFYFLNLFGQESWFVTFLMYIMVIGVINMYNFMDGINGITGAYSLVVLGGLQYVNLKQVSFIGPDMIWLPMIACVVFLFFNFRKKARCFAGDVGSVTIALWIIMLQLRLITQTHNWVYILFLVVYGIDSVLTITHRVILKQNILKAHRMHFYQVLANEHKISHLLISSGYALVQLIIIAAIIAFPQWSSTTFFLITILPLILIYVTLKPWLMSTAGYQQHVGKK